MCSAKTVHLPENGYFDRLKGQIRFGMGGIRVRIALYFLLAGSSILILGLLLTNILGMRTMRQTIGANFQEMARTTAHSVGFKLGSELRHMGDLAKNPQIVSNLSIASSFYKHASDQWIASFIAEREKGWRDGTGGQDAEVMENDVSKYLRTLVAMRKDTVLGICIADEQGALLAASSRPLNFDLRSTPWWQAIKSGHTAYISDFLRQGSTLHASGWIVEMALPIYRKKQLAGAVHIAFMAKPTFAMVREIRIGQTGHAMIVDDQGTPQLCPVLPPMAHVIGGALLHTIAASKSGWNIVDKDAHGGSHSIIGFAPVRIEGRSAANIAGWHHWHTFIRQDPQETYASLHTMLWKEAWVGTILLVLLAIAGLYAGRRIEQPLRTLRRGARLIGSGDLQHRIAVQSSDEIGALASEFNAMADNILRARNERVNFANAVMHAGDAIIITDLDAKVFYVNPAFEKLTGFTADEAIGKTPRLWKSNKTPKSTYQEMWGHVLAGGAWTGELINKRKNGRLYHAQMTVSPIRNDQGEIISLLGVQRDVTEQRAMEAELRRHHDELETLVEKRAMEIKRARDELESLLEHANDVIFTLDANGCFMFVNTQIETWDYKKTDIVGKPFSTILSKQDAACTQDCELGCQSPDVRQGRLFSTHIREFCISTKQNNRREVMISVSSLADGNTLVIARDMTEIKQLQRQIADSEKMRTIGEMATMLAHDFRNPLSTVKMNLQILSRKPHGNDPGEKEHFKLALGEVATLEHLLSSMLEFAKPVSMDFEWHDLHQQLDGVLHSFKHVLKDKRITLECHFNAATCEVRIDSEKIKQVWSNLFLNAIQAMPDSGELTISSANERHMNEPWIVVQITDHGHGIPRDVQKRIFDPFFTMRSNGTGLGLAIVKKIVDAHHGKITVASQPGEGTTFSVALRLHHISEVKGKQLLNQRWRDVKNSDR